jgi:hypothetical protein
MKFLLEFPSIFLLNKQGMKVLLGSSSSCDHFSTNNFFLFSWCFSLHYANISVGTPSLSFLVALDTRSDLFWLPCECKESGCIRSLLFSSGAVCY